MTLEIQNLGKAENVMGLNKLLVSQSSPS
jgi:hypothetical protein